MSKKDDALKLAREWIGESPERRTLSAGKMVALLTEALAEQPAQQQDEQRELVQVIAERDYAELVIDALCDAVLGKDRPEWSSEYGYEDAIGEVEELIDVLVQPAQQHGCSRSHPHENMDVMCELRTEIARLTNENARLKAQHQEPVAAETTIDISADHGKGGA